MPAGPEPHPCEGCGEAPAVHTPACDPIPPNADVPTWCHSAGPILGSFTTHPIHDGCDACDAVALAGTRDGRLFAATRSALVSWSSDAGGALALPDATMGAPAVAADHEGRAWVAALQAAPGGAGYAVPSSLLLASWDGASSEALTSATLTLAHAPALPLVERVHVAASRGAVVVVLASNDTGWAIRTTDGGETWSALERITPHGIAMVGPPVVDPRGRVLVPFALRYQDPWTFAPAWIFPTHSGTSLHFAALASPTGAWTLHGGFGIPQGVDEPPRFITGRSTPAFLWTDPSGAALRIESWDDGTAWGSPMLWSDETARLVGAPNAARAEWRDTSAWWEESGRLVVTRGTGLPEARAVVAEREDARGDAPIVLLPGERAAVAWVDGAQVWLAVEDEPALKASARATPLR